MNYIEKHAFVCASVGTLLKGGMGGSGAGAGSASGASSESDSFAPSELIKM